MHLQVLCTTVGEAFSDLINETVGLGLAKTAAIFGAALLVALVAQFAVKRYIVPIYWVNVVLISVEGTLATDAMTDGAGIPLWVSTLSFGLALIAVFVLWWVVERTLSVHTIYTTRRELFCWLTIFVTFALGTAVGALLLPHTCCATLHSTLVMQKCDGNKVGARAQQQGKAAAHFNVCIVLHCSGSACCRC